MFIFFLSCLYYFLYYIVFIIFYIISFFIMVMSSSIALPMDFLQTIKDGSSKQAWTSFIPGSSQPDAILKNINKIFSTMIRKVLQI